MRGLVLHLSVAFFSNIVLSDTMIRQSSHADSLQPEVVESIFNYRDGFSASINDTTCHSLGLTLTPCSYPTPSLQLY